VVASAIFGIVHLNPIQVFYAFFLGLVFGWLYYRTGSLMPCIVGHVLNNSLAALTMCLGIEEVEIAEELSASSEVISVVLCAAIAVFMAYLINAKQPAVSVPWRGVGDEEKEGEYNS
jgi:membrane protease YdiL (CAAX protease family)